MNKFVIKTYLSYLRKRVAWFRKNYFPNRQDRIEEIREVLGRSDVQNVKNFTLNATEPTLGATAFENLMREITKQDRFKQR